MQLTCNLFIPINKPSIPRFSFKPCFCYSTESNSVQSDSLKTLEWNSICKQLSAFTSTSMGSSAANNARLPVGRTPTDSQKLLDQTSAARLIPQQQLDFSGIHDLTDILSVAVSGRLLTIPELCTVRRTLAASRELFDSLKHLASVSNHSHRFELGI
jgi:DNA mismatch repair protein MutS2